MSDTAGDAGREVDGEGRPLQHLLLSSAVFAHTLDKSSIARVWGDTIHQAANVYPEFCLVYNPPQMLDPRTVGLVDAYEALDKDSLRRLRLDFPLLALALELALGKIERKH